MPWAEKQELIDYGTRAGFVDPAKYADDVIETIMGLQKGEMWKAEVVPDTMLTGEDKGKFIFNAWGSAEVIDSDRQILPIDDIVKAMPFMIKRGGTLHLGHTNQPVGRVLDFWLEEYKEGGVKKGVKGLKFKAELFGDFKSDLEARKGVLDGALRMVSLGGKSHTGLLGMAKDGGQVEIMKDLEVWEFALVRKGKNPLAFITDINGIPVHKGEEDEDSLLRNPHIMRTVHSLLLEGVRYKDALKAARDIISGTVTRNITKGVTKGESAMTDKTTEERVADLEKGMADLKKDTAGVLSKIESLNSSFMKGLADLKKELVIPGKDSPPSGEQNPPPPIKKELDEDAIAKALKKALSEMGFSSSGLPSTPRPVAKEGKEMKKEEEEEDEKKTKKGGVLNPPDDGYATFEQNYIKMMASHINKGAPDIKDVPSFVEMGAEINGIPIHKEG